MNANPYGRYQEAATLTANRGHLVVMLYDAAIRACRTAQGAIGEGKVARAHAALLRAQDILGELRLTLDMSQGDLAAQLDELYRFMGAQLVQANVRKDSAATAEVQSLLEELRSAWVQVSRGQGAPGERG